jgi:hypothetical protein
LHFYNTQKQNFILAEHSAEPRPEKEAMMNQEGKWIGRNYPGMVVLIEMMNTGHRVTRLGEFLLIGAIVQFVRFSQNYRGLMTHLLSRR